MSDVTIAVNGRSLRVQEGATVAAALVGADIGSFRTSVGGSPRGAVCGMGTCYECRLTIDGVPHQRACMRVVSPGMVVKTGD